MELKKYQKNVLDDLKDYLNIINSVEDLSEAFDLYWNKRDIKVGIGGVPKYNDLIKGVPHICFKIPTGGGKTFVASHSIKTIFENYNKIGKKFVVWLVPSDSILEQTLKNLKNVNHPYRQTINASFNNRVEIYTKDELLNGQNFNISTVEENLGIVVLTFDSFRITNKEGRRIYQENSNLQQFTNHFENKEKLIEDIDETALIQVINQLNPLVIVDESHNAVSDLSIEMLKNINPSFILDLTATPKENSNVLVYIDASILKKENMVKLPVIAYNRPDYKNVIIDAIDLRNKLEKQALIEEEQKNTIQPGSGKYIRPIVLFQAQPKNNEDNTTFEKLKDNLINIGIPSEEIAIKTAEINELKNIDLLSRDCKIKYIITVNALKEGWDCPFAYILASISNKSSKIDVEQILGRILRQPYTYKFNNPFLNMSYVLTSSNEFKDTLDNIISGLNSSGFSKNDYRVAELSEEYVVEDNDENHEDKNDSFTNEEIPLFSISDTEEIKNEVESRLNNDDSNSSIFDEGNHSGLETMLQQAENYNKEYEKTINDIDNKDDFFTSELIDKTNIFTIKDEYKNIVNELEIPIFSIDTDSNFFGDNSIKLTKDYLMEEFELSDKPLPSNLSTALEDIYQLDVRSDTTGSTPIYTHLNKNEIAQFKKYLDEIPDESKKRACIGVMCKELEKLNYISKSEIDGYVTRIIDRMSTDELADLENNIFAISYKIRVFIENLAEQYRKDRFSSLAEKGVIKGGISYKFPNEINILDYNENINNSLYQAEKNDMNKTEFEVLNLINSLDNILWWHRINARDDKEFYINGFINHYPDFIFMTKKGNVVVVEVKGEQLKNDDSKDKLYLGRKWQQLAGDHFRYYMVFMDNAFDNVEGAYDVHTLCEILKEL